VIGAAYRPEPSRARARGASAFRIATVVAIAAAIGCSRRAAPSEEPGAAASSVPAVPVAPPVWTGATAPSPAAAREPEPEPEPAPVAAPAGEVPDDAVITLERTACFGSCPAYRVELHGDGRVVFEGEGSVRVAHAERRIPRAAAANVFRSLAPIGFWTWKAHYRQPITDHPSATVAATWGAARRSVEEYPPCTGESGAPPALCALGKAIDDAARTSEWTTCKNAGGRVIPCPRTPRTNR
jgi:Domain of unknown function (DUF6438)